jgi:hypothetical protein
MTNKILAIIVIVLALSLGGVWGYRLYQEKMYSVKSEYFDLPFTSENIEHSFLHQVIQGVILDSKDISGQKVLRIGLAGKDPIEIVLSQSPAIIQTICNDSNQMIGDCISEKNYVLKNSSIENLTPGKSIRALNIVKWNKESNKFQEEVYTILIMPEIPIK